MIYTVTFNPALDYVIHMDQLHTGEVNRTQKEAVYYGGKGINVSIVLNNLGIAATALGFLAGFTGREIAAGLARAGIRTDFVELKEGLSRINVKIKGKEETDINGGGPAINESDVQELMRKIRQLQEGDTLVLAGSIPSSLSADIYERILEEIHHKRINVVVDAEKELLVKTLHYRPFLIKPNHHELGAVFGKTCDTEQEIVACVRKIQEMGARNVLVSRAGDGALLCDETGRVYTRKVPKGIVKNSVGAGDSMVAGFLAGYETAGRQGLPLYETALNYGVAAGSATAFSDDLAGKGAIMHLLN